MSQEERDKILLDTVKRFDAATREWSALGAALGNSAVTYKQVAEHIEGCRRRVHDGISTSPPLEGEVKPYPEVLGMLEEFERIERLAIELCASLNNQGHRVNFPPHFP